MKLRKNNKTAGFSLIELLIAMTVTIVLLGIVSTLFSGVMSTRKRESSRTDALTAAQAALNVMSREVANSGYGLNNNGLITGDSNTQKIHFRSNVVNTDATTTSPGEDVTYFYDTVTQSIVRYDANGADVNNPSISVIVNRVSKVDFKYFDYKSDDSTPSTEKSIPTSDTARVTITVTVDLEAVRGQPSGQSVKLTSDVTLRNSDYMLFQY